jgi:hypothetical protein
VSDVPYAIATERAAERRAREESGWEGSHCFLPNQRVERTAKIAHISVVRYHQDQIWSCLWGTMYAHVHPWRRRRANTTSLRLASFSCAGMISCVLVAPPPFLSIVFGTAASLILGRVPNPAPAPVPMHSDHGHGDVHDQLFARLSAGSGTLGSGHKLG